MTACRQPAQSNDSDFGIWLGLGIAFTCLVVGLIFFMFCRYKGDIGLFEALVRMSKGELVHEPKETKQITPGNKNDVKEVPKVVHFEVVEPVGNDRETVLEIEQYIEARKSSPRYCQQQELDEFYRALVENGLEYSQLLDLKRVLEVHGVEDIGLLKREDFERMGIVGDVLIVLLKTSNVFREAQDYE